ncbi:MAG TPA: DUF6483 family protein [Vicinamibacteria bacterium]|nr:DUF6483 family protein [Vicinamibacteria bacterium]
MFQRDYILRLLEQFARALGVILSLRKAGRLEDAEADIAEASREFVGLDVVTLLALPLDQVVALLSPGGSPDPAKCLVLAELLFEKGEVSALRDDEASAYRARLRSLGLLLEVSGREGLRRIPDADRHRRRIETLLEALSSYGPVVEIQKRLVRHHEQEGDFAAAEDTVFELLDSGQTDIVPEAIGLYERLLGRSDEELERGRLPRDEVEESLARLRPRGIGR